MINIDQFRNLIVRPTLEYMGLHSPAAEELLMGTAAQESGFVHIHQLGQGPALGLFQMEPATHDDIWNNYLRYQHDLAGKARDLVGAAHRDMDAVKAEAMIGNLDYACAMCRIHYRRVKAALPGANDIDALGSYWKQHYNTTQGRGTVDEFVNNYYRIIRSTA
jgi:hypothetical protein